MEKSTINLTYQSTQAIPAAQVFDQRGYVIGVVTMKAAKKEGLGFCIPLTQLSKAVETSRRLTERERVKNSSMHNLRGSFELVAVMGEVYMVAMAAYDEAIRNSFDSGGSADRGLRVVQRTVQELLSRFDEAKMQRIEFTVAHWPPMPTSPIRYD